MSTSPAKDIAAILALDGVATEATDLFVDEIPEKPDFCVVVRNTTGFDANPAILVLSYSNYISCLKKLNVAFTVDNSSGPS